MCKLDFNSVTVSIITAILFLTLLQPASAELQVQLSFESSLSNPAGTANAAVVDGNGSTAYVTGKIGQGLQIQNPNTAINGDYIWLDYTMPDSGTVALWYKPTSIYNYNTIFDNSSNPDDWEMWIYSDSRVKFRVESGTEVFATLNTIAPDSNAIGKWFHIAVTWTRDGNSVQTQMYTNGILASTASGPWVAPGSKFYLGGGNNGNIYGNGVVDEVMIYNNVLTASEIKALALAGLEVYPTYIDLSESTGTTYNVYLTFKPQYDVTITITPDIAKYISLNGLAAGTPATLTFTPANYSVPQTVTVFAVDDAIHETNRTVNLLQQASSSDPYWAKVTPVSLTVYIRDNDCGAWGYPQMDFNKDCYVDLRDFAAFSAQWMSCTDPANLDCSGPDTTFVIAHRGNSSIAPENTIAAFNAARGYADYVELDAYSSADGVLVVMHDSTVERTTDGTGSISSKTLTELKQLDAGSWFAPQFTGERIPTLSEALAVILPDMTPTIERKGGTATQYVNLLRSLAVAEKVVVISFDSTFLNAVHALAPEIRLGLLGSGTLTDTVLTNCTANGIRIVDWSGIAQSDIDRIHAQSLTAFVWTINDTASIQNYIRYNADGITTDKPVLARELIDQN